MGGFFIGEEVKKVSWWMIWRNYYSKIVNDIVIDRVR